MGEDQEYICKWLEVKPKRREQERLNRIVREWKYQRMMSTPVDPQIIEKEKLKDHQCLIIEVKKEDPWGMDWWTDPAPILRGLIDIEIDEEKNELSGYMIMVCVGKETQYIKMIFSLDKYRKLWRAWNTAPKASLIWD